MGTQCYAMVRGSTIRVTGLGPKGNVPTPAPYAVSKSVAEVRIDEVVSSGSTELLRTPEQEKRLRINKAAQTIRYRTGIRFLRVDPGILSLVAGVELVYGHAPGFGEVPFGVAPFGGSTDGLTVVGFDSGTRLKAVAFALEVWSKLDSASARPVPLGFDEVPFDEVPFDMGLDGDVLTGDPCGLRRWGYTLFPYLKGGYLDGFTFENGLVSFNLIGAQTRRMSRWGVGPHPLDGTYERLTEPVSRNTHWRTMITTAQPPAESCGLLEVEDILDNGTAANPMPDPEAAMVVDGGGASTTPWIIEGGRAT